MARRHLFLGTCLALLPLASQAAHVMLVDGIQGTSTKPNYSGWFDATAVSWSIDRASTAAPHGFDVTLESIAATASLAQLGASGTGIKRIVVDTVFPSSSNSSFLLHWRLTCEEAVIRVFAASASTNQRFTMQLRIQCGKLSWEGYDYQNDTLLRSAKGSWNFKSNTP